MMNIKYLSFVLILLFLASCQEKKFDRFEREAKDYTERNCPKRIDPIATLDSIVFHNDGSLNYIYYYSISLDEEMMSVFEQKKEDIRTSTLKTIRNSVDLKSVKEAGLNIVCDYRNTATGKEVVTFTFTKEDYQ